MRRSLNLQWTPCHLRLRLESNNVVGERGRVDVLAACALAAEDSCICAHRVLQELTQAGVCSHLARALYTAAVVLLSVASAVVSILN